MEFDGVKCHGEVLILVIMESLMFGGFVLNLITLKKLVSLVGNSYLHVRRNF